MNLLRPEDATHTAVASGDWSDPTTWRGGKVPGAGAEVHIPGGIDVTYGSVSDTELSMIRVDGGLHFATDASSRMKVDTIFSSPNSTITIGTKDDPVEAGVDVEIVFVDGAIDLSRDPTQVSRGLVSHGEISVHGARKAAHLVLAEEPMAGDKQIVVEGGSSGWQVGDTVVVMGTHRAGRNGDGSLRTQDEERTITAIDGNTITLDSALSHDHDAPDGHGFEVLVGNASRNVTFSSENPDGVRGHFMVMHHPDADIRYAAFDDLGRTDKTRPLDDDANPKGRYSLHLHRAGTDEDDMAIVVGNAVSGSPGWGIVHHDSVAAVDHNFVYDVVGAGIVSESGNERGQWIGNFVTKVTGDGGKIEEDLNFGSAGVAYENQGRQIIQQDNVAANAVVGWAFRHPAIVGSGAEDPDEAGIIFPDRDLMQFDPFPLDDAITNEEPQIMGFVGNTAAAVGAGFDSGKRVAVEKNPDLLSQIVDFDVWRADAAIDLTNYTGHYVFKDSSWVDVGTGIHMPRKHAGSSLIDVAFENVRTAVDNPYGLNYGGVLVNLSFENVGEKVVSPFSKMPLLDNGDLTSVKRPILEIDPGSDLTIGPNDRELRITGTITDTAGERSFASNEWLGTPGDRDGLRQVEIGISESFGYAKDLSFEEAFALHGTFQQADGDWIMPVWYWISDRVTAETYPYLIEVQLEGFGEELLKRYEIAGIETPDRAIRVVDTRSSDGIVRTPSKGDTTGDDVTEDDPTGGDVTEDDTVVPDDTTSEDDAVDGGDTDGSGSEETPDDTSSEETVDDPDPAPTEPVELTEIRGTEGRDRLIGEDGDEAIYGLGGNDVIRGAGGYDLLFGGDGNDRLDAVGGVNVLDGGAGDDRLRLLDGTNTVVMSAGSDRVDGFDLDTDTIDVSAYPEVTVRQAGTNAVLEASGATLTVLDVSADALADTFEFSAPDDAADDVTEEGGTDGSGSEETVDDPDPAPTEPVELTEIRGTEGRDRLIGEDGDEAIYGLGGNDVIRGAGGYDLLFGGDGNDRLDAVGGVNVLDGGAGDDRLRLLDGTNTVVMSAGSDRVDGFDLDTDTIDVSAYPEVTVRQAGTNAVLEASGATLTVLDVSADALDGALVF